MDYTDKINNDNTRKIKEIMTELPRFCSDYFRYLDNRNTSSRTRLGYAYDLRLFFRFVKENNPVYKNTEIRDFTVDILDLITPTDIEEYISHLSLYADEKGMEKTNGEKGKSRKLASLRTMYNYFYKKEFIKTNPPAMIDTPKAHKRNIVHLDKAEVSELLAATENGNKMTSRQLEFHEKTRYRDTAIITLLLGTGIRVSELVGIDIQDIDFKNNALRIVRKGGNESMVYFGDEVATVLMEYLELERGTFAIIAGSDDTNALFLSLRRQRITTRSVEVLVKKYSNAAGIAKKITPHKLRSTYGTNLYKETGDIYLVADALGHRSVETTRQHYAATDEERRKLAGKFSGSIFSE